jgi:hypothetical protein
MRAGDHARTPPTGPVVIMGAQIPHHKTEMQNITNTAFDEGYKNGISDTVTLFKTLYDQEKILFDQTPEEIDEIISIILTTLNHQ